MIRLRLAKASQDPDQPQNIKGPMPSKIASGKKLPKMHPTRKRKDPKFVPEKVPEMVPEKASEKTCPNLFAT